MTVKPWWMALRAASITGRNSLGKFDFNTTLDQVPATVAVILLAGASYINDGIAIFRISARDKSESENNSKKQRNKSFHSKHHP